MNFQIYQFSEDLLSNAKKTIATLALSLLFPACYASSAAVPYNMVTAPDMASRAILAHPVHFEDGAASKQDVPAAINRNYPLIIEQNFARIDASTSNAVVDRLSDVELKGIAQLYTNANADSRRTGSLLLVAANRMDGAHLARMAKFFGYAPVYDAVSKVAPLKAQSFAQNAPIIYAAPVAGQPTASFLAAMADQTSAATKLSSVGSGTLTPMQSGFKPAVSMTFEQLYTGFRTMQVGSMAGTAALYETVLYSGMQLSGAYAGGYAVGTGLTWVAQNYMPDWYYGTFVGAVGNTVDWLQNTANAVGYFYGSSIYDLGNFEATTAPTMSVPNAAVNVMSTTGGDAQVTQAMVYNTGYGGTCGHGYSCWTDPN